MKYTDTYKTDLLKMIGNNVKYYCYHCNNQTIMNERGIVTIERLAEEIDSSPNMLYNLTAKNVEQGVSLVFIDKIARALDVDLYYFFLRTPVSNPNRYTK